MGQVLTTIDEINKTVMSVGGKVKSGSTNSKQGTKRKREFRYAKKAERKKMAEEKKQKEKEIKQKQKEVFVSLLILEEVDIMQKSGLALPGANYSALTKQAKKLVEMQSLWTTVVGDGYEHVAYQKYLQWKEGLQGIYDYLEQNKQGEWDSKKVMEERAKFNSLILQCFLLKQYKDINKLFIAKVKELGKLRKYHIAMLFNLCNLVVVLRYYTQQDRLKEIKALQCFRKQDRFLEGKTICFETGLQLVMQKMLFCVCDVTFCQYLKSFFDAFDHVSDCKFKLLSTLCKESYSRKYDGIWLRCLENAPNILTHLWRKKQHGLDIQHMVKFCMKVFDMTVLNNESSFARVLFYLNPCKKTYTHFKSFYENDLEEWHEKEEEIVRNLICLFEKAVNLVLKQDKQKKVVEIFMFAHAMETLNRYMLLDAVLSYIKEFTSSEFTAKDIELLCLIYLKQQPQSQKDIELMDDVIELLQKTGLKCRDQVKSMMSDEEEDEVKHSKTRMQKLKAEVNKFKEEMRCPISQRMMLDPVVFPCGHAFERCNIARWRQENMRCPTCKKVQITFYENYALKNMALPYLKKEQERYRKVYKEIQLSMNMQRDAVQQK